MWVIYASLNPVSESIRSLFAKKASKRIDPLIISWANNLIPTLVFLPFLFFTDLKFNPGFWLGCLGSSFINVIATILYMRAISEGDISAVMPMLSFTPVFLLFTSPVLVGEFPALPGLVGVILVVAGSYILNIKSGSRNFLDPLLSLVRSRGTRYMLIVSFIWSISSNFDKISINNSSPVQHIIFVNLFIFFSLSTIVLLRNKFDYRQIVGEKKNLLIMSCFTAGTFIFHMTALSMTLVAYVVAMKRMSGFLSVLLGYFFLDEGSLKERLLGASIMFAGVILIIISG